MMTLRNETYGAFTVEEFATDVWRCYRTDFGPGALLVGGSHAGCVRVAKDRARRHASAVAWRAKRATAGVASVVPESGRPTAPPARVAPEPAPTRGDWERTGEPDFMGAFDPPKKLGCWNPDTDPKTPEQIAAVERALERRRAMGSRPVIPGRTPALKRAKTASPKLGPAKDQRALQVVCPHPTCTAGVGDPCTKESGRVTHRFHRPRFLLGLKLAT